MHCDPIGRGLAQRDRAEVGDDIRRDVATGIRHLVEELLLRGAQRDRAPGAGDFAEHAIAFAVDIAPWKAELREVRHVLQSRLGEIAAGHLPRAFEQVPDRGRPAEALPVVQTPMKGVGDRCDEERRIGDAAGDQHLRAGSKRRQDLLDAEIGVGRDERAVLGERRAARLDGSHARLQQ